MTQGKGGKEGRGEQRGWMVGLCRDRVWHRPVCKVEMDGGSTMLTVWECCSKEANVWRSALYTASGSGFLSDYSRRSPTLQGYRLPRQRAHRLTSKTQLRNPPTERSVWRLAWLRLYFWFWPNAPPHMQPTTLTTSSATCFLFAVTIQSWFSGRAAEEECS